MPWISDSVIEPSVGKHLEKYVPSMFLDSAKKQATFPNQPISWLRKHQKNEESESGERIAFPPWR